MYTGHHYLYIYLCFAYNWQIIFVSESGEDTGGLRREFFRLLCHGITENYFIGTDYIKTFQQNVPALQVLI